MPRNSIAAVRASSFVVLLMAVLSGCGESPSNDFKAYDELEQPTPQVTETAPGTAIEPAALSNGNEGSMPANGSIEKPEQVAAAPMSPPEESSAGDETAAESVPTTSETERPTGPATDIHGNVPAIAEKPLPEEQAPAVPRKVELLIKEHDFPVEGGHLRVSYDDIDLLRVLNMEPVTPDAPDLMPKWLRELDGKRIRIRGFMYPPFEETGIARFVLARDNQICCFGRDPKVYDLIDVQMRSGKTTHYIQNRPFDVTGVFHIEPVADPESLRLYSIDDAEVIER